uniref:Uncharacterized protein n=1 Tax=viral metagenome TaxID=1070528 RepID=A0A6H1ZU99_9ZZZZ
MLTSVKVNGVVLRLDLDRVNGAGYICRGQAVIMKVPRYSGLYMAKVIGVVDTTVTFEVLDHPRGTFYSMVESDYLRDNVYKIN